MVQNFVRSPSYKNDFKVCMPMKKWHELAQPIMRKKLLPTQKTGNNKLIIKCSSNQIDGRGGFRYNILNCVTEFPHEKGRAYEQQRYRKDPERASEIHAGA